MSNPNTTKVVTGVVRLSYEHVWEPASINGSNPKYSVSLIIPKSDTKTVNAINAAIDAAIEQGIGKFGGKKPNKAAIKLPLRDGDIERDDEAYANSWFVNANSTTAPQIVDQKVQPILDRGEVYSGCYARVSINFYAFNSNGNKGVACGLGNIQKVRDGEPLGGKRTGATLFRSIATSQTITFTKNNSNPTYWVAKIVPVPVRYSHHMIFMYTIGYNYSSSYNGQIGTICFDTTTNSLISIGQAAVNSSSWPSGSGAYNYLTYNSYGQGCMLANAVRTNSGYIRFWPGYNSNSSGYVYSMAEGGSSFSSYSTHYSSSLSDYSNQACYVALYKNDRAHIARQTVQYLVQFSGTSGSDVSNSSLTGITNYANMGSLTSADSSGNYTRSLTFSADGLKSYFMFQRNGSPYQMCLWTNSATDAAPVYSELDEGNTGSGHLYNSNSEKWSIALSDNRRYTASAKTLLTEKLSGQYAQSFPFAANCARNCYGYHTIAAADPAPVAYQLPLSAGFVLNSTNDGVIVWNEFGQVWDMKFFDQNVIPYKTWTCPEDGTYKIILVGGGAAGGAAYGGGSGYLMIGTVPLEEGDTVEYFVGKGGVYNAEVPLVAMESSFGTLRAAPGNGRIGGADGASTASGGGGGGYNLVTFGGQGQNYAEGVTAIGKDRNGGQSANSGACTSGDGYGAGGAYCQNGKDGVIVILR